MLWPGLLQPAVIFYTVGCVLSVSCFLQGPTSFHTLDLIFTSHTSLVTPPPFLASSEGNWLHITSPTPTCSSDRIPFWPWMTLILYPIQLWGMTCEYVVARCSGRLTLVFALLTLSTFCVHSCLSALCKQGVESGGKPHSEIDLWGSMLILNVYPHLPTVPLAEGIHSCRIVTNEAI